MAAGKFISERAMQHYTVSRNQRRAPIGKYAAHETVDQVFFLQKGINFLRTKPPRAWVSELPVASSRSSLRLLARWLGWFCTSSKRNPGSAPTPPSPDINARSDDGGIHSSPLPLALFSLTVFIMEYTAPVLPMNELRALLSEVAFQQVDKVFAHYPFEFFPRVLFNARWQRSPYLGRYLISNFKKGWFVYLFCGVNAAVFAIWRYPSLLDLPSKLFSSSQTKQQRQAKSGRSSRGLGNNVRTIHDLNRGQEGASSERSGSFLSLQNEANHLQTLRRHFTISLDNIAQGRWWTILGGAVSHQNFDHIGKNLTTFITVASIGINRGLSNGQLICVCLGSAVAGSVGQLWHFAHKVERDRQSRRRGVIMTRYGLGASGIVSGLSVAMAVLFPYTPVQKFAGMLPMPLTLQLWTVPLISFAYDLWMLNDESSKIGHGAHLGGAIFGGLYSFFALRRLSLTPYRW